MVMVMVMVMEMVCVKRVEGESMEQSNMVHEADTTIRAM